MTSPLAALPRPLKSEVYTELKKQFPPSEISSQAGVKGSAVNSYLYTLAKEKEALLGRLKDEFSSLGEIEVLRQIDDQSGEVWDRYQALAEEEAKLGLYSDLLEVTTITPYVKDFHMGTRVFAIGAAGMAFYYRRSQPLIAVACGVFALSMGILYKFVSELQRFSYHIRPIFEEETVRPENTSTRLNEMIAEVYQKMMGSTLILSRYLSKMESLYVDHQSKEKKVDHARMFKGQVEALKALKKKVYEHPYRKAMSPQEMKTVYGKYHGVLSSIQKGIYLWGGMATMMTAFAFYRRVYLMIGVALAHVGGAYYLSRIISSRVSHAAELKNVSEEAFNDTYMKLFYSSTQPLGQKGRESIQAQVIQLDTILKLIPQTA